MVRERVGGWRLAWRFALAGVIASILVIALAQTGVTNGTFDNGQDRLFPAPAPDPRITLVAIDQDLSAEPRRLPPCLERLSRSGHQLPDEPPSLRDSVRRSA